MWQAMNARESVASSAIEGLACTLEELIECNVTRAGAGPSQGVFGCLQALDAGLSAVQCNGVSAITKNMICQLHEALYHRRSENADELVERFRKNVVWIGPPGGDLTTSTWNPPPPDDIESCLSDTIAYLRSDIEDLSQTSSIVRAAIAHAHFEAVHPFQDGNGRIGRILISMLMSAEGGAPIHVSNWLLEHRSAYYSALEAAQKHLDYDPLIGLMAEAVIQYAARYWDALAGTSEIKKYWDGSLQLRKNSTADRVVELLAVQPVVTARFVQETLDVSFKAASVALGVLERCDVLVETTGQRRDRVFKCPQMIAALDF